MDRRCVSDAEPAAYRALTFQDHFASRAGAYARFRPRYPPALFDLLAALPEQRRTVLDVGTGSGQAAVALAERFDRVIAIDASAAQLANATPHPRVEYRVARAEETGAPDGSIDLVTVAQAAHWFELDGFYREVRRVAVRGGAIALWSYDEPVVVGDAAADALLQEFSRVTMGPWWPFDRARVGLGYATLPFPFAEVAIAPMTLEQEWTRDQLAGYVRSWSSVSRYVADQGEDPVVAFERDLARTWPDPEQRRRIEWPLVVRAGRL